MIVLIMVILIIVAIMIGFHFLPNSKDRELWYLIQTFVIIFIGGCIVTICILSYQIKGESVLQKQIIMLEEENKEFEQKMETVITDYMKHESDVFEKVTINSDSLIFFVTKYPELTSDKLVSGQIEKYNHNKRDIVDLNKKIFNIPRLKWLLWFVS